MKALVACAALLVLSVSVGPIFADDEDDAALEPGQTAPLLKADGWINGEAPTAETVKGKVWVADFFAYW